ncbi:toxin-antitoxin system YwqK family antitoxin [Tenacibaculum crassostreae]|uniref:toxin-antitoxin system YwqK family antitoxin n=1 Tax=Tenacibaculum crassostreae TaxID=502683 RepID=UPI0038944E5A
MRIEQVKYLLLFIVLLVSCKSKETRSANSVDLIEKISTDESFALKNGVLFYKNKLFSGIVNTFYSTGELKSKSKYILGKRDGFYNGWYPNGNKFFERLYAEGLKSGVHVGWYENGQSKFIYHFNERGDYNGEMKEWYSNGQLYKVFNYNNGREEGSQKMWQPNGKIRANFVTKNDERFGLIGLKKCYSVDIENEVIQ